MNKKELTIIIPFLNEKYEVEETLKSIRDYSDNQVEILLINDASDDGFDYTSVAEKYGAFYFENSNRIGVAASRDKGVSICKTDYFLLLDAHMRFYDKLWAGRILEELHNDPTLFLCCQTKALRRVNGLLAEDTKSRGVSYGAYVRLEDAVNLFEPKWIVKKPADPSLTTLPVPCVLGAGYACSKTYWLYLKGLEGLMQYGNDEAYISMKVWMAGGSCKLVTDVEIGHIYRHIHPYTRDNVWSLYNRLFLSEIFLPQKAQKRILSIWRLFYEKKIIAEVQYRLFENSKQIDSLKAYYQRIFIKDLDFFRSLNDPYLYKIEWVDKVSDSLKSIVARVVDSLPDDIGLLHGRMGIVLFLYHYARYSNDPSYWDLADEMLKNIIKNIKSDLSYCLLSGLCGVGWGIEYLYQHGFIDANTNQMLEYIDKRIMEINPLRMEDLDKEYGFGGIVLYLLARLHTIQNKNSDTPFDDSYLSSVYQRVKVIIDQRIKESNSVDVYLAFLSYYETKTSLAKTQIYDVCSLVNPKNISLQDLEPGLKGCAGVGMLLLLEE